MQDYETNVSVFFSNVSVVLIMKDNLNASIKAIETYCSFHRLLIEYIKRNPELKEFIDIDVQEFIEREEGRIKKRVPDLGVFLSKLMVSEIIWGPEIAQAYFDESIIRNMRWMIDKYPELGKQTEDPEIDKKRVPRTLLAVKVSFNILFFHIEFLNHMRKHGCVTISQMADTYDEFFGKLSDISKGELLEDIFNIKSLSYRSWK